MTRRLPTVVAVTACLVLSACTRTKIEIVSSPPEDAAPAAPEVAAPPAEEFGPNLDVAAAQRLLAARTDVVVLDVRTPAEFAGGHLAGAVNVDFKAADFAEQAKALDRATTYLVHCRSGRRSTASLATFEELDFTAIHHLDGGMLAWEAAGGAVEK